MCARVRVRYLVKPKMGFWGSFRKGSAHLRPRGRARAVGKSEESGVQAQGRLLISHQLLQGPPCTWGLGKVYYLLQVAQGGEDVCPESKTEDSGDGKPE